MAESEKTPPLSQNSQNSFSSDSSLSTADHVTPKRTDLTSLECPICLQACVHPVELPCHHIFCFLCIKGVAMQGPHLRCAICRSSIPSYVLSNPKLKDISQLYLDPSTETGFQWFYESRSGGWWGYEQRTAEELERAYQAKSSSISLMIAGNLYDIDLTNMVQYRANNRALFRRMKRDVPSSSKKGIAGIRVNFKINEEAPEPTADGSIARPLSRPDGSSIPTPNAPRSASAPASAPLNMLVVDSDEEGDLYDGEEEYGDGLGDFTDSGEDTSEEEAILGCGEGDDKLESEARDGARAPTVDLQRSGRSTGCSTQTPPSPTSPGLLPCPTSPNSRGKKSRLSNYDDNEVNIHNNIGPSTINNDSSSPPAATRNGEVITGRSNTSLQISPTLRITLECGSSSVGEEIL